MTVLAAVDVDQSPRQPITVGYDLATAYDDTLVVVHVMTQDEFGERQMGREELPEGFDQNSYTVDQARQQVAETVSDLVQETLGDHDEERVTPRGNVGSPADELLQAAEELDPRYVVVGGRRRSAAKQAVFGSVSQRIMREATQPVVTMMEPE